MPKTVKKNIDKTKFSLILSKIPQMASENFTKRLFVSMLAVEAFQEYLKENDIEISDKPTLHSIPAVVEKFDLADIKLSNNVSIDIRTVVGKEYPHLCIPREHFQKGIQADIYVGVRIDANFKKAEIIGFVKAEDLSQSKGNQYYLIVNSDELTPVGDIENAIKSITHSEKMFYALDHEKAAGLFIPFIDKSISDDEEDYLLKHISSCRECRTEFKRISTLDYDLRKEKNKLLLDLDYTLRLITNDPVFSRKEEVEVNIQEETSEELEDVLEESPEDVFEEFIEEKPPEVKKISHRDWADELAANAAAKNQEDTEEKTLLSEESLMDTDLRDQEVPSQDLSEKTLEDLAEPEKPELEKVEEKFEVEKLELEEKPDSNIPEPVIEENEVEDILESLNDVETLQDEENIDSLLSFFDHEMDNQENEIKPEIFEETKVLEEQDKNDTLGIEPLHAEKDTNIAKTKGEEIGYTSVLRGGNIDENIDILVKEDMASIEEIRQEDLMHIFDVDIPDYKVEKDKEPSNKDIKSMVKSLLENKNLILFASGGFAIVLLMLLLAVQLKQQLQNPNNSPNNPLNANSTDTEEQLPVKRERKPLTSYTREIVKVVKPEKTFEESQYKKINEIKKHRIATNDNTPELKEIKIKDISWELPSSVVQNSQMKEYFLNIGQQLTNNLSKELYLSGGDVENSIITIYAELNSKGEIVTSKISESSGIEKVDKICINALSKTTKQYKLPATSLNQNKIKFLLLIRT